MRPTGKGINSGTMDPNVARTKCVRQGPGTSVAFMEDTKPAAKIPPFPVSVFGSS